MTSICTTATGHLTWREQSDAKIAQAQANRRARTVERARLAVIERAKLAKRPAEIERARVVKIVPPVAPPIVPVQTYPVTRLMVAEARTIPRVTLPDGFLIEHADALAVADAETYDAAFDPDFIFFSGYGWPDNFTRKADIARIANLSNEFPVPAHDVQGQPEESGPLAASQTARQWRAIRPDMENTR